MPAGTGREYQPADNHVHPSGPLQRIDLALDSSFGQNTRVVSWKEAAEMKERVCSEAFGDALAAPARPQQASSSLFSRRSFIFQEVELLDPAHQAR